MSGEPKNPFSLGAYVALTCKVAGCLVWGFAWGAVGCALVMTVIGIAPGVACLSIAAAPLYKMVKNRDKKVTEWQMRHATHADIKPPWEEED
jgi:hypothetical protein